MALKARSSTPYKGSASSQSLSSREVEGGSSPVEAVAAGAWRKRPRGLPAVCGGRCSLPSLARQLATQTRRVATLASASEWEAAMRVASATEREEGVRRGHGYGVMERGECGVQG